MKMKKIASLLIVLSVVILPAFASADNGNKGKGKDNEKNEKQEIVKSESVENHSENKENKKVKSCMKAWGHLFAPGFVKWNVASTTAEGCFLPFGIGKKFGDNHIGSSTPDTLAPTISNLVATGESVSAKIRWNTNENSNSVLFYSTSTPVTASSQNVSVSTLVKDHSITLSTLVPNTTYYVLVSSKDKAGNNSTSSQISFTTLPLVLDVGAPVISNTVATIGTTTINVGWKTNELATSRVYYSLFSPLNISSTTTNFIENSNLLLNHILTISGLSTSTNYYLMLESKDSAGNVQRSDEFTVKTSAGI